jgi:hypothetical protein
MSTPIRKFVVGCWWLGLGWGMAVALRGQAALVQHAPDIAGRVDGSVQQMAAENLALEGTARITGGLRVPGSPSVRVSPRATLGEILPGSGEARPSHYAVELKPGATVGRLRPRTDPVPLPVVGAPERPTGRRDVTVSRAHRSVGDFSTVRDLELKEGVGAIAVPPGAYGEFKVHGRSALVLGEAGARTPTAYSFRKLELKSDAVLDVVGPVIVTLGEDLKLDDVLVGNPGHPEWLTLRLVSHGLELKEGTRVFAAVAAPRGEVTVGNRAELTGEVASARLTVRRNGVLSLRAAPPDNVPPDPAPLPFLANFEAAEGYAPGPLAGQQGWEVADGTALVGAQMPAADGSLSVEIGTGATVRRRLGAPASPGIVFADLYVQPAAGPTAEDATTVALGGARVAWRLDGNTAQLMVPAPEGAAMAWQAVGVAFPADAAGRVARWVRLTLRLDFPQGSWDLWADGNLAGADLALAMAAGMPPAPGDLVVTGSAANPGRLDSVYVGGENPLFADADHDGMDDVWEAANGLDCAADDRSGDRDGDGISNLREYLLGLRADRRDTDGDGMTDDWELAHGLDPKVPNSLLTDTDGDGIPDADEFLIGTDPTKADTDGDGLPDLWEARHQLDPQSPAGVDEDADGDGLTNRQEFAAGTDPHDFFNGVSPVTSAVTGGEAGAGDRLELKVTRPDGMPWANAPVDFEVTDGGRRLSPTPGGPAFGFSASVRADPNGIARVYLEPLEP